MKVFSLLSSLENVAVFTNQGQRTALISCVDYGQGVSVCAAYSISIRVWGIASFILTQVLLQPSVR